MYEDFVHAVVHLLLCPVYLPVEDRKDVLIAVGLFRRVFSDDLTGLDRRGQDSRLPFYGGYNTLGEPSILQCRNVAMSLKLIPAVK